MFKLSHIRCWQAYDEPSGALLESYELLQSFKELFCYMVNVECPPEKKKNQPHVLLPDLKLW